MVMFQSPRSGKFVSDIIYLGGSLKSSMKSFNPLDRGNLYQIVHAKGESKEALMFQSPRSGKFVSDMLALVTVATTLAVEFQSPRSGKFVSDSPKNACKLTMSFKRTTLCRHYITNGKMFENVAKKIF